MSTRAYVALIVPLWVIAGLMLFRGSADRTYLKTHVMNPHGTMAEFHAAKHINDDAGHLVCVVPIPGDMLCYYYTSPNWP